MIMRLHIEAISAVATTRHIQQIYQIRRPSVTVLTTPFSRDFNLIQYNRYVIAENPVIFPWHG
jgi:hypothetical protein